MNEDCIFYFSLSIKPAYCENKGDLVKINNLIQTCMQLFVKRQERTFGDLSKWSQEEVHKLIFDTCENHNITVSDGTIYAFTNLAESKHGDNLIFCDLTMVFSLIYKFWTILQFDKSCNNKNQKFNILKNQWSSFGSSISYELNKDSKKDELLKSIQKIKTDADIYESKIITDFILALSKNIQNLSISLDAHIDQNCLILFIFNEIIDADKECSDLLRNLIQKSTQFAFYICVMIKKIL